MDSSVISYGPCQTPTLGFCVDRHDEILSFVAEDFWELLVDVAKGGVMTTLDWSRGRVFDFEVDASGVFGARPSCQPISSPAICIGLVFSVRRCG